MFERPNSGERAVLVYMVLGNVPGTVHERAEFQELVVSAGAVCAGFITGSRDHSDARFFVGRGKVEEIRQTIREGGADLVIFNHDLTPSQERNLEAYLQCRVLDRTGLILDIFAQRARSFEGKLQVELAQLRHLSTRLVRGWTHLERQKGGIGLRGPGETQLETDRRLVAERIKQIDRRLRKVERQRSQGRQARRKAETPTVSLVGYTNTGKSTLFNRLTNAGVWIADQLFATLDPTLRRLNLPSADPVVIADTVGFINHLPHELVAAFHSTLQETCEASLLLHVIDASNSRHREDIEQVNHVLQIVGASNVPQIQVYNKIDRISMEPRIEHDQEGKIKSVWISASEGHGINLLLDAVAERVKGDRVHGWIRLPPQAGRLRARLFGLGAVITEQLNSEGEWLIEIQASRKSLNRLFYQEDFRDSWLNTIS